MKMKLLRPVALLLIAVVIAGTATSVDAKKRAQRRNTTKPISQLVQELRNLDLIEITDIAKCRQLKQQVEKLALPYFKTAYGKNATTTEAKTTAVLAQVVKHAKVNLEGCSTMDMVDAGYIHRINHNYNSFVNQEHMLANAPAGARNAITGEWEAWQKLQKALLEYCVNASALEFFGGSMAILGASGSAWNIAEMRDNDAKALDAMGFSGTEGKIDMKAVGESAAALVTKMAAYGERRKESILDEDKQYHPELYQNAAQGIDQAMRQVTVLLPQWLEARKALLEHAKRPAAGITATSKLLETIDRLVSSSEDEDSVG
jgi:hypothetical protein